jgi:pantothenate kinase
MHLGINISNHLNLDKMQTVETFAPMLKTKLEAAANANKRNAVVIRKAASAAVQQTKDNAVQPEKTAKTKPAYIVLISTMVGEGKFTRKEIIKAVSEACKETSLSSIQTVCTDCKNPKYNRLPQLVVTDDKGVMSFKK